MKIKTPKKLTHAAVAKQLGISRQLLSSHLKSPSAPALDDLEGWRTFLAQVGRSGSAPPDLRRKIAEQRLEILKEQRASLARKNAAEAGELMPCASALKQAREMGGYMFAELERMAREIPPALAGQDAVTIGKRISAEVEKMRKTLTEKALTISE